jgi:hypothetical protein
MISIPSGLVIGTITFAIAFLLNRISPQEYLGLDEPL